MSRDENTHTDLTQLKKEKKTVDNGLRIRRWWWWREEEEVLVVQWLTVQSSGAKRSGAIRH